METMLVRLKPYDPRRGHVLRRFTYRGIKLQEERGWYRVEKAVAEYLAKVRQDASDPHSPLAFDVCTAEEAKSTEAREQEEAVVRRSADGDIKLSAARGEGAVTTGDLPEKKAAPASGSKKASGRKAKKDKG